MRVTKIFVWLFPLKCHSANWNRLYTRSIAWERFKWSSTSSPIARECARPCNKWRVPVSTMIYGANFCAPVGRAERASDVAPSCNLANCLAVSKTSAKSSGVASVSELRPFIIYETDFCFSYSSRCRTSCCRQHFRFVLVLFSFNPPFGEHGQRFGW